MSFYTDLVSVVMPAYNAEKTIREAIDSVLDQSYSELEVVIVDDASTDGTAQLVRSYEDPRVRLFSLKENAGEGAARDSAISHSRGRWLAVIDADDAWAQDRLEKLMALQAEQPEESLVIDNIMRCIEVEGSLEPWQPIIRRLSGSSEAQMYKLEDYLNEFSYLIKPLIPRGTIERLDLRHSEASYGADAQFFIRLLKETPLNIVHLDEPLYFYRMNPVAMSAASETPVKMKNMLEGLLAELDFSGGERSAIQRKIRILDRQVVYEPFTSYLEKGEVWKSMRYGMRYPICFMLYIWRLPGSIRYRRFMSRSGGMGRPLY